MTTLTNELRTQVVELYVATFGRSPDAAGLTYWTNKIVNDNWTVAQIAKSFFDQTETQTKFPSSQTTATFIDAVYSNTLGHTADAAGKAYWQTQLDTGKVIRSDFITAIVNGAKAPTGSTTDASYLTNKTTVAEYYAVTLGLNDTAKAATVLSGVTSDASTVTSGKAAADVVADSGKIKLTSATTDDIKGTGSDDVFKGVNSAAVADGTLQVTDKVDGDAGADTLGVDLYQDWTGFTTGSVKNVETMSLVGKTTAATTWNATGTTGVTKYVLDSSKAVINLSNVEALASVEVKGPAGITADTTFTAGYAAASTVAVGTQTDTQVLKLTDVGTKNTSATATSNAKYLAVDIDKVEAFNITTAGAANSFDLSAAADAKTVTIAGAGVTDVKAVSTGTTSFDAAGATDVVVADLTNAASGALTAVKSGSGDDKVTIDLADLSATATLAGGAGTDQLIVAAATGGKTLQATMSGFESLYFSAPAAVTGAVVFSGTNVTDLTSAKINAGALGGNISLVNMGAKDFTVNTVGALTGNTISSDNTGVTTINMSSSATATTSEVATTAVTTAGATTVNVGEYVQAKNVITSTTTGAVTLNVASKVVNNSELSGFIAATAGTDGKLAVDNASSVTINATGALTNANIQAAKATTLSITAGSTAAASIDQVSAVKATTLNLTVGAKGLDMETGTGVRESDLSKVQVVAATNAGHLDFTDVNLSALGTGTFAGSGTAAKLTLANVGASTQTYNLALTASGQKAGMTVGAVDAGTGVATVDVSGVTGDVTMTTINGDGGVTLNAKNVAGTFSNGNSNAISAKAGNILVDISNVAKAANVSSDGTTISTIFASTASGASGTLGGDVAVLATNAIAGANIGILTGKNVTVDATNALGTVKVGNGATAGADIYASTSVTYKGANLSSLTNAADIKATDTSTALAVNLTGGAGTDTYTVTGNTKQTSIVVSGDVGAGTQSLTVTLADQTSASTGQTVDLSGYKGSLNTSTTTTTVLGAEVDGAITYKGSAMNDAIQITAGGAAYSNSAVISITDTTTTDTDTLTLSKGATPKDVTLTNLSISGIEKIAVTGTTATDNKITINASAISGKAMDVSGTTTSQSLSLSATTAADVIDLSSLTTDGTNFIGLVTDAGAGNDSIVLATATAGAKIIDTIVFGTAATNGADTIVGFTKGSTNTDVLKVVGLGTLVGSGAGGGVAATNAIYVGATAAGTKGNTAVSKVVSITDTTATDWSDVVAKIGAALTIAADTTAGNAATAVLIGNGTDTRVYFFNDDATSNSTVESTELTLVGTLTNVTASGFVEGNFALS